jgi:hypothetical protein
METHVRTVGILHIIFGSLGALLGIVALLFFGGLASFVGVSAQEPDSAVAVPILGGMGGIIFVVALVFSLPGLIGGIGLLKLAPWSRVLMIVISALELIHIPFGTALGIYGLWALTKPETAALFERQRYQPTY